MYPYLRQKVVVVEGPMADGVYDLNAGSFQRINKAAGRLLRLLIGLQDISEFDADARAFVAECDRVGWIDWHPQPMQCSQTPLVDVIRAVRPVRFAWIELTSKCNQLCKHCFLGSDLNSFAAYEKDEVFEFLRVFGEAGARQVILSGGEPVAHPEISEIIAHAGERYSFKISLLTNGSHGRLLKILPLLKAHEVTVKIPLLGWGETHDFMAGMQGGFSRTMHAINVLIEHEIDVELGTTVTAVNFRDVPQLRKFARELDIKLVVSPLYKIGFARSNADELHAIPQQEIVRVCREGGHEPVAKRKRATSTRLTPEPTDYDAVDLRDYLTEHSECGQKIVAVLSNREVTPCLMLREKRHSLGSLHEHDLATILSHVSSRGVEFDEMMRLDVVPGCKRCEARFVCKAGGCPASALAFAGSVQVKNPLFDKCYYKEFAHPLGLAAPISASEENG